MMEKRATNDEIDLVELLVKVVLVIKRNILPIILFFIIGTGLGYAYASLAPKVYESKMLVSSEILTESYSEKLFENLQTLIIEQNFRELSNKIGISAEESMALSKLEIESALADKPPKEDDKKFFLITVKLSDQSILAKLQAGLLKYFQENDFVKLRVENERTMYQQLIIKMEMELKSLEDFKLEVFKGDFFKKTKGDIMFDPTAINSRIVEISKQREELIEKLALVNGVEVVEGFTQFDKPIWPKKSLSLAAGASLGLLLVGLWIAFKSIRKLVRFAESHPSHTQTKS